VTDAPAQDLGGALRELAEAFPGRISDDPDELGGLIVTLTGATLPASWPAHEAPLMFVIPFTFPGTPIYPYYLPADVAPPGLSCEGVQPVDWRGMRVIQLSLRHNNWRPGIDSALGSVLQALDWLRRR
jgi:hypothetical protein